MWTRGTLVWCRQRERKHNIEFLCIVENMLLWRVSTAKFLVTIPPKKITGEKKSQCNFLTYLAFCLGLLLSCFGLWGGYAVWTFLCSSDMNIQSESVPQLQKWDAEAQKGTFGHWAKDKDTGSAGNKVQNIGISGLTKIWKLKASSSMQDPELCAPPQTRATHVLWNRVRYLTVLSGLHIQGQKKF